MEHKAVNEELFFKYLLGELSEEEMRNFEESYFLDDDLVGELQAAERELIDRYVEASLSKDERYRFEHFFLSTPARKEKLRFARALKKYVPDQALLRRRHIFGRISGAFSQTRRLVASPVGIAASIILILCVALTVWRVFFYQSLVDKGMAALRYTYRDQRPLQSRISEFDYAPQTEIRGGDQPNIDYASRSRAERNLLDAVFEDPGPASYHALGRFYLTGQQFDKAIDQFKEALKSDPTNAQLHSDLGAALLEKGKASRSGGEEAKTLEGFAESLEHFNRALELDDSLLEALFNRAILFENLMLPFEAEEDWREYIEKDRFSKWADEAREHLRDIEKRKRARIRGDGKLSDEFIKAYHSSRYETAYELIKNNTDAISDKLLWWQLLGAYLDLVVKGDNDQANQYLRALAFAGNLQQQKTEDRFISELAQFYRIIPPNTRAALTHAHAMINQAHELLAKSQTKAALYLYRKAKEIFDEMSDELESKFVDYWIGYCLYRESEFNKGLALLSQLAEYCRAKSYLWLLINAVTTIANINVDSNHFSIAINYYKQSLVASEKTNDLYNLQKSLTSLAYSYRNLGNRYESLRYMQRSLESAESHWSGARQMYRNYDTAAQILNSFGYYAAAVEYEKAALQIALEDAKDPGFQHLSYLHLGAIHTRLRNYSEALRCADLSYQVAKSMSDERTSLRPKAHSLLQLGHIHRQTGDYEQGVTCYDEAVRLYENAGLFAFLYEARKGRLLCYIAQANDSLAREELQTVLALFEEHRSKIKEEKDRNTFFDVEQNVYDVAIDFEYSRNHDSQRAFEHSEASRARSLYDLMTIDAEVVGENNPEVHIASVSQPLGLNSIRGRLSEGTQILQYAVLDDKLLIWVVSRKKFEVKEFKINPDNLTEKVLSYYRSLTSLSEGKMQESAREATDLYRILVEPVESLLEKEKQICVVPDKVLNWLPFNALISPSTGKYLINDYSLTFAPSSNVFLICSEVAEAKSQGRNERILSVGDPHFNRDAFGNLPYLPSSGKEAREVAGCYESGICLIGKDAKKEKIKSEMETSDVIHLASHYVVNERNPMLSNLLLTEAATGGSAGPSVDGVLQAYEIYQKKLPLTRLVVLSACRTGIEKYYKGEGMIGMSRTFLAAGVPLVVASLWPVDSDQTADLMISFHKYRKHGGLSSAKALRQAQLDMINNSPYLYDRPYYWAAFMAIGGYTCF